MQRGPTQSEGSGVTVKRDKTHVEPKAERPKLKKEALRDLAPDRRAEDVRGGMARRPGGNTSG